MRLLHNYLILSMTITSQASKEKSSMFFFVSHAVDSDHHNMIVCEKPSLGCSKHTVLAQRVPHTQHGTWHENNMSRLYVPSIVVNLK